MPDLQSSTRPDGATPLGAPSLPEGGFPQPDVRVARPDVRLTSRLRGVLRLAEVRAALFLTALFGCGASGPPPAPSRAELRPLAVPSDAGPLLGFLYLAAGVGPRPTVLLLHGFPGIEQNHDLAHAIRRGGWNVVIFHYRGAWGSPGEFSFGSALEDGRAALRFLREGGVDRVDPGRIAVVGHSLGGSIALHVGADDPAVLGVASLAGFDFGEALDRMRSDDAYREALGAAFEEALPPLRGAHRADLLREVEERGEEWRLPHLAPRLAGTPVMLVSASADDVAPPDRHERPLAERLAALGTPARMIRLHADHGFVPSRLSLASRLLDWLEELPEPR